MTTLSEKIIDWQFADINRDDLKNASPEDLLQIIWEINELLQSETYMDKSKIRDARNLVEIMSCVNDWYQYLVKKKIEVGKKSEIAKEKELDNVMIQINRIAEKKES